MSEAKKGDEALRGKLAKLLTVQGDLLEKLGAVRAEMDDLLGGKVGIGEKLKAVERAFDAVWCSRYARGRSGAYLWKYAVDRAQSKRLLGTLSPEEIGKRAAEYLQDDDPFVTKARHPFGLFVARINSYVGEPVNATDFALSTAPPADCRHTPTCASDQVHTRKVLEAMRA